MRRSLSFPVIVNDQVTSQPHQPVLQIALLWIVLLQRPVNPYKDFLGQIFGSVGSGGKSVGKVIDAAGVGLNNHLPCRSVARATPANEFGSFTDSQSLYGPHPISPATFILLLPEDYEPSSPAITTTLQTKFRSNSATHELRTTALIASPFEGISCRSKR